MFKTTQGVSRRMGIDEDYDVLLTYFGEWFMSLTVRTASRASVDLWSLMVRWLKYSIKKGRKRDEEKVEGEVGGGGAGAECGGVDGENGVYLEELYNFCAEASDLPRAFPLAVLCYEAISASAVEDGAVELYNEFGWWGKWGY